MATITCYHVNYSEGRAECYSLDCATKCFHEVSGPATLTEDTYKPSLNPNAGHKLISSEVILEK